MALPDVAKGDPHIKAHNNERQLINKIQDLTDTDFARNLSVSIANKVAASVTIRAVGDQTDFIDLAERFSSYTTMEIRKAASLYGGDPQIEVSCIAPNGDHVTYDFANKNAPGTYRFLCGINEGSTTFGYIPDPSTGTNIDNGALDHQVSELVRTGVWNTASTYYTTEVFATWSAPVAATIKGKDAKISLRTYGDNRGGIWRLSIVDRPDIPTVEVSTFSAVAGFLSMPNVMTVPGPGTYVVRGTFMGADPANAPSGGTARGWLLSPGDVNYTMRVSDYVPIRNRTRPLKIGPSNQDFAVSIKPVDETSSYRFVPNHDQGESVEVQVDAPRFYDGTTLIDVDAIALGERRAVTSFELVQHIKGRNTTVGDELVEIYSKQRVRANGAVSMDVSIKGLQDLLIARAAYAMMFVVNPTYFDRMVSSVGNVYGIDTATHPNGSSTALVIEGNRALAYAAVSASSPDLVGVVRFNNVARTLRANDAEDENPTFIEHRTATLAKLYPRIGYLDNTVVPAGTVWHFSGDFFYGRIPGIGSVIAP